MKYHVDTIQLLKIFRNVNSQPWIGEGEMALSEISGGVVNGNNLSKWQFDDMLLEI